MVPAPFVIPGPIELPGMLFVAPGSVLLGFGLAVLIVLVMIAAGILGDARRIGSSGGIGAGEDPSRPATPGPEAGRPARNAA